MHDHGLPAKADTDDPTIAPDPTAFVHTTAGAGMLDLGTRFMWQLGGPTSNGGGSDAEGSGAAPPAQVAQRHRGRSEGCARRWGRSPRPAARPGHGCRPCGAAHARLHAGTLGVEVKF